MGYHKELGDDPLALSHGESFFGDIGKKNSRIKVIKK